MWASTCFMAEETSGGIHAGVYYALKAEQAIVCIATRERVSETALKILSILEETGTLRSAAKMGLSLYRVLSGVWEMGQAGLRACGACGKNRAWVHSVWDC